MRTIKSKKRIVIASVVTLSVLTFILVIAPFTISAIVLNVVFGTRFTTNASFAYTLSDFDGLKADRYEFCSNNSQMLAGYKYYVDGITPLGVVVIAHGFGGGGHNGYMDCAYFFAKNGFYVFAYDATGNDESEGKVVGGLPQGVIDLDYAISFVESQSEFANLPIFLFGHSWGGYSVANVLNFHPEVKAIVSVAGFNKASDLMLAEAVQVVGRVSGVMMPYVNAIQNAKFGQYAQTTAMDGFANSSTKVMIVQGGQDAVVPQQYGYEIYLREYKDSDRFTFVYRGKRGHSDVYFSEDAISYIEQFNKEFSEYFNGANPTEKEHADYVANHLDRNQWCTLLDTDLFAEIVQFYISAI